MAQPATPDIKSYLNTLNHLCIPDGAATGEQLNLFLNLLQRAATQYKTEMPAAKQLIVFGKEVAYMDTIHRGNIMAQIYNASDNDEQDKEKDDEKGEWKAEMQLWGTCQEAVLACKATAINLILVASHPHLVWENTWAYRFGGQENDAEARKQHYDRLTDWHAYAVKIQDRQAWIYDGSYMPLVEESGVQRRLHQLPFMKRAWDLIKAYKGRNMRIDQIFVGGGGNDSSVCQDMACHWIRGEVMSHMGRVDSAVPVENWEKVAL
jgi:hypothetical protein